MTERRSDLWTATVPTVGRPDRRVGPAHAAPARRPSSAARPRRRGWLVAVLGLVALVALLLGLVQCGAQRGGVDAAAIPSVPTAVIAGAGAAAAPSAPVPGSLTADTTSLFAAVAPGGGGLAALVGQTAIGHAVPVQSVPADEGFWIGTSTADRVWVQFTSGSESSVTIMTGQLLDLSGPVVPHGADFARKAGVSAPDGAVQLTRQGAHLEVDPKQVKVVGAH